MRGRHCIKMPLGLLFFRPVMFFVQHGMLQDGRTTL